VRWKGKVVYVAPAAALVPSLMTEFFDSVEKSGSSDPVKNAGRGLLRLLKIHPFGQANGRTARALATYMLLRQGYKERPFKTLEKYMDENIDQYYDALAKSSVDSPEPWDAYFLGAAEKVFKSPYSGVSAEFRARIGESFRKAFR